MKTGLLKRHDKGLSLLICLLSILLLAAAVLNRDFFQWAFARHQNQLSWYIRPLFLIPFCFFAYRRSLSGLSLTLFLLLTSMFWFPEPDTVSEQVKAFLAMEQEYLSGSWDIFKLLITLLVPLSLTALALAFWKRSLWLGISVLVFIAVAKMLWSVVFGGASGFAVIAPAVIGLILCVVLISLGFRKLERKRRGG